MSMQSATHSFTKVKDGGSPQTGLKGNCRYEKEGKKEGGKKESRQWLKEKACDALNEGVNKYVSSGSSEPAVTGPPWAKINSACV